jgi:hypothetical protein
VRQKGGPGLPGTPPRSPPCRIPRCPGGLYRGSIAQGSGSGPNCFQALSSQACYRVPYVNRGTPVAPLRQPQLNVLEKKSHPRGSPCSPLADFPRASRPHLRRAAGRQKTHVTVCVFILQCVFITAAPISKPFAVGEGG